MNVTIEKHDAYMRLVYREQVKNTIVFNGRAAMCDLLGYAGTAPNFISLGTGSTGVKDSDVALENEVFRNSLTRTILDASKVTYQLHVLTTQSNSYTIAEVGLFTGPVVGFTELVGGLTQGGGTLFARATPTAVDKDNTTTMTITWEIPIQSSED